jgi:hypothetical protein
VAGYIYILSHKSGSTVKVGETRVSPKSRQIDYTNIYQLEGFKLAKTYEVPEGARKDVERRAHQKLRQYRLSGIEGERYFLVAEALPNGRSKRPLLNPRR